MFKTQDSATLPREQVIQASDTRKCDKFLEETYRASSAEVIQGVYLLYDNLQIKL